MSPSLSGTGDTVYFSHRSETAAGELLRIIKQSVSAASSSSMAALQDDQHRSRKPRSVQFAPLMGDSDRAPDPFLQHYIHPTTGFWWEPGAGRSGRGYSAWPAPLRRYTANTDVTAASGIDYVQFHRPVDARAHMQSYHERLSRALRRRRPVDLYRGWTQRHPVPGRWRRQLRGVTGAAFGSSRLRRFNGVADGDRPTAPGSVRNRLAAFPVRTETRRHLHRAGRGNVAPRGRTAGLDFSAALATTTCRLPRPASHRSGACAR